jgi:hypothetical protein
LSVQPFVFDNKVLLFVSHHREKSIQKLLLQQYGARINIGDSFAAFLQLAELQDAVYAGGHRQDEYCQQTDDHSGKYGYFHLCQKKDFDKK